MIQCAAPTFGGRSPRNTEIRSPSLTIDRFTSRSPERSATIQMPLLHLVAVPAEVLKSIGIVLDASKTELPSLKPNVHLATPRACQSIRPRLNSRRRLSKPCFSLFLLPLLSPSPTPLVSICVPLIAYLYIRTSDRRPEVKLQLRATNFRNSLSSPYFSRGRIARGRERWTTCRKEIRSYERDAVGTHDLI